MTSTVTLTTAQAVSLARGFLACPISSVVEVLNELTDDSLYTHQLPRAIEHVESAVIEACPWSEGLTLPDVDHIEDKEELKEVVYGWVDGIIERHGNQHEVPTCTEGWVKMEPIAELVLMLGERTEDQ